MAGILLTLLPHADPNEKRAIEEWLSSKPLGSVQAQEAVELCRTETMHDQKHRRLMCRLRACFGAFEDGIMAVIKRHDPSKLRVPDLGSGSRKRYEVQELPKPNLRRVPGWAPPPPN